MASAEAAHRRPRPKASDIPAGAYDPIRKSSRWKFSPAVLVPLFLRRYKDIGYIGFCISAM